MLAASGVYGAFLQPSEGRGTGRTEDAVCNAGNPGRRGSSCS
jgi:hypothetical protein